MGYSSAFLQHHALEHRRSWGGRLALVAIVAAAATLFLAQTCSRLSIFHSASIALTRDSGTKAFHWKDMPPSETLEWHSCYSDFLCARFAVPLNYSDEASNENAILALIRLPSRYPVGHPKWKGPIIYNPGGPGGSGVFWIRYLGALFKLILGDEFDHIGFDPRGVGFTTPAIDIWKDKAEQVLWAVTQPTSVNGSSDHLARMFAADQLLGWLVEQRRPREATLVSTAFTARDMLRITEAFGHPQLQYWGVSYGSVLVMTFASMFPDRVGKIVVDGVIDMDNYINGRWDDNLLDTDAEMWAVYEACAKAPHACALYEPTPRSVKARVERIFDQLKQSPLVVYDDGSTTNRRYGTIDAGLAKWALFRGLYSPYATIPGIARAFGALERGDGQPFFDLVIPPGLEVPDVGCSVLGANSPDHDDPVTIGMETESIAAIACGDAFPAQETLSMLRKFYERLSGMSYFSDVWLVHAFCSSWRVTAVESFRGPFGGNTSHPLLFIGNTADPVTPLSAAQKMSRGFNGAAVLTQNNIGHASTAAVSPCTYQHLRAYFRNGITPEHGTTCEVINEIFPALPGISGGRVLSSLNDGEQQLAQQAMAVIEDAKAALLELGPPLPAAWRFR